QGVIQNLQGVLQQRVIPNQIKVLQQEATPSHQVIHVQAVRIQEAHHTKAVLVLEVIAQVVVLLQVVAEALAVVVAQAEVLAEVQVVDIEDK
ncbi:MAG: hypothetical protein U9R42_10620, partial [Bacteroidota bacterium]|nr:hypothetical protein [Bacteroidota bacterium]